MRRFNRLAVAGAIMMASTSLATLQEPRQPQQQVPGAIRSRVTLVPVDVRVIDRQGRPVAGLTQDDFTVLEDGVPQKIGHFAFKTLSPETPGPARPALRKALDARIENPTHRTFLIAMGRGRLHGWAGGYNAAIRFVREHLLPQDKVAITAWNRATDFTTDHARLVSLLERLREKHNGLELKVQMRHGGLEGWVGSKSLPPDLQTEVDALFDDAALSPRQLAAVRIRDEEGYNNAMRQQFEAQMDRMLGELGRGIGDPRFDEFFAASALGQSTLAMLYSSVEYLKYFEGEKHLVLINETGIYLPRAEDDEGLAATASDGRVAIHTILTGGTDLPLAGHAASEGGYGVSLPSNVHGAPLAGSSGLSATGPLGQHAGLFAMGTMRTFATRSGGYFSTTKKAQETFDRIDTSTRSQYEIGYYPSSATWDGGYRKIEVKVNRPDLSISSRRGYFANEKLMPFDRRQFLTHSRITNAVMSAQQLTDIRMSIKTRVEGRELIVEGTAGTAGSELDLAIFAGNRSGEVVGEKWTRVAGGVPFVVRVPVKAGPSHVKAVVYDYAADLIGVSAPRIR